MANQIKQIKLPSSSGTDVTYDIINPYQLTVGQKTYDGSANVIITAADLGLSGAMLFLGTTTSNIADGSTTNPITINSKSVTVTNGNVAIYGNKEFVWTGSLWEELGNEGNYKVKQTAVSSPSASGSATAFIDTISQDAEGVITVTKKNIPNYAGSSSAGGSAISAEKLNTNAGSATQPVYFADGVPVKTTYTLEASVPAGAKFTDTTYDVATSNSDGLMSAADKAKIDGIQGTFGRDEHGIYIEF